MIFNSLCLLFLFINVYYIINYQRLDEPLRLRDFSKKLDLLYYFLKVVFIIWVLSGSFCGFSPIYNFMISVIFLRIPMFYLGKKRYDKRGAVGTYHYTDINHLPDRNELFKLKQKYTFVALENGISSAESMYDFVWPDNSLIIVGEEGIGITKETLDMCDKFVYIPQYGSVRSLNAASALSIALYDYVSKYKKKYPIV